MTTTTLFTITGCYKCKQVKEYLMEHGINFEEVNILEYPNRASELEKLAGEVTVPFLRHQGLVYKFRGNWKEELSIV